MNIKSINWLQTKEECFKILELITKELLIIVNVSDGEEVRNQLEKNKILLASLSETKSSLRYYYKNNNSPETDAIYNRSVDLFEVLSRSITSYTTILSYNKQEKLLENK